jgi:hypothetical protein
MATITIEFSQDLIGFIHLDYSSFQSKQKNYAAVQEGPPEPPQVNAS